MSDFLISKSEGMYCRYGDFYLDPQSPVPVALISHAHGDHAVPGNQLIYCTLATSHFMKWRYANQEQSNFETREFYQPFFIKGIRVTFIPAGHILGSAQILMEFEGVRYLYTGDYKLQSDSTCEAIALVKADVLITESTFADPDISHPDPIGEIKKLNDIPHSIVIGVYSLGKAQRVNQLINDYCPDRSVLVHRSIYTIHKIYEQLGVNNLIYQPYQRRLMKENNQGYVYLVPPLAFKSYDRGKTLARAFASGWKHLQKENTISLYISDHVDWEDILYTIEQVDPREIWTLHGDGRHLANHYKNRIAVKILST